MVFVALLATSASGVLDLAMAEPCPPIEASSEQGDQDCAATCVRCTCCAQSIEILSARPVLAALRIVADLLPAFEVVPAVAPSDILHVPKARQI